MTDLWRPFVMATVPSAEIVFFLKYTQQKKKNIQYSLQNYIQLSVVNKIFILERNL